MQTTIPEVGKTYHSTTHPGFTVRIVRVAQHQTDSIFIHAIDKSEGGEDQAIELWGEEWEYGKFISAASSITDSNAVPHMQTTIPEVGKTYISQEDPALTLYVEEVLTVPQDEIGEAGFVATCCRPEDKGNKDAPGYEFLDDEWRHFHFIQAAA